jgi:hypothetical protein
MVTCRVLLRFLLDNRTEQPRFVHPNKETRRAPRSSSELLYFLSLAHSFAVRFFPTPLQSICSALFHKNTGGGYIPRISPLVFKRLGTPQNSLRLHALPVPPESYVWFTHYLIAPLLRYISLCLSLESRCISMENASYPFSLPIVARLSPAQRRGYTHPPSSCSHLAAYHSPLTLVFPPHTKNTGGGGLPR